MGAFSLSVGVFSGAPSKWAGALALLHDGDILWIILPYQRDSGHRGHGLRGLSS